MGRGGHWAVALVCVVLGFLLSMQFKVQQRIDAGRERPPDVAVMLQRNQDLAAQLAQVEKERDSLKKELAQIRAQVAAGPASAELVAQLKQMQVAAGLTELRGPGVRVVLDDSARPWKPGENPNLGIIHDRDIWAVVNELLASGAEAIAVNGQRLTGRTEIRCVGPTVIINGVRTATPVEILAIGNPDTLERGLKLRGGVVDELTLYTIQVTVEKKQEVRVPPYRGSLQFEYARPVEAGRP